jgi:xanthine dehydrogenase accessory factor
MRSCTNEVIPVHSLIDALTEVLDRREPACLVTVAKVRGSAPRDAGARMLVTETDTIGTIGGGQLEYQCIRIAVERIRAAESGVDDLVRTFPLGSNCGQCCGGVVDVLFESVTAESAGRVLEIQELHELQQKFVIAIFGAGHVGSATVATLAGLDCQVRWIDSRSVIFPENLPANVVTIETDSPAGEVARMPPGSYYLVMTHSHSLDLDICDQVLRRRDAQYCGLIGSLSKRRRFERLLRKQGVSDEMLAELSCPIGVSGIPGKRPQEIAIAVAAELLQIQATAANKAELPLTDIVRAL